MQTLNKFVRNLFLANGLVQLTNCYLLLAISDVISVVSHVGFR